MSVLGTLLDLPPKARIGAGLVMAALGVGLGIALLGRGVIAGVTIFLAVGGFFLTWSGIVSHRRESKQQAQLQDILARKDQILEDLVALKRSGGNPVRYLNEQGILDGELRADILERMKERLARSK